MKEAVRNFTKFAGPTERYDSRRWARGESKRVGHGGSLLGAVRGNLREGLPEVHSALPVGEVLPVSEEVAVCEPGGGEEGGVRGSESRSEQEAKHVQEGVLGGAPLEGEGNSVDRRLVRERDPDQIFLVAGGAARPGLAIRSRRAVLQSTSGSLSVVSPMANGRGVEGYR